VKTESAAAVAHHCGVSRTVVIRWRKALDVNRKNNEGTIRLLREAAEHVAKVMREREWSEAERKAKRRQAKRQNLIDYAIAGFKRKHG
jgi:hypothetical protein